jgi:hypothetical protein
MTQSTSGDGGGGGDVAAEDDAAAACGAGACRPKLKRDSLLRVLHVLRGVNVLPGGRNCSVLQAKKNTRKGISPRSATTALNAALHVHNAVQRVLCVSPFRQSRLLYCES